MSLLSTVGRYRIKHLAIWQQAPALQFTILFFKCPIQIESSSTTFLLVCVFLCFQLESVRRIRFRLVCHSINFHEIMSHYLFNFEKRFLIFACYHYFSHCLDKLKLQMSLSFHCFWRYFHYAAHSYRTSNSEMEVHVNGLIIFGRLKFMRDFFHRLKCKKSSREMWGIVVTNRIYAWEIRIFSIFLRRILIEESLNFKLWSDSTMLILRKHK